MDIHETPTLKSAEYKLTGEPPLGRGCWGVVYPGINLVTGQRLAFKFLAPNAIARAQMADRGIDNDTAARKMTRGLNAAAHLIPTIYERDDEGTPFAVMPRYDAFLHERLEEVRSRPHKRGMLKTGLTLDEAVQYGSDIATGVMEFHRDENRAHHDLKPDNIAMDSHGHLLIGDFGTATVASTLEPEYHRSNRGFVYTRAPWLFGEEDTPHRSCDTFAFGSMLFKLFTDNYLLQEEIDAFGDDEKARQDFMKEYRYWNIGQRENHVHKRIANNAIPREFRTIITRCATGEYANGEQLLRAYQGAMRLHEQNKGAKRIARKGLQVLAGAVLLGGVITVATTTNRWLDFYSPEPDYATRLDLRGQIAMRAPELSKYQLEAEVVYPARKEAHTSTHAVHRFETAIEARPSSPSAGEWRTRVPGEMPPSLAHSLIDEYVRTADELGYEFNTETGQIYRDGTPEWSLVNRNYEKIRSQLEGPSFDGKDGFGALVKVAEYALGANRTYKREWDGPGWLNVETGKIDLENTLMTIMLGGEVLDQYRQLSNGLNYHTQFSGEVNEYKEGYDNAMSSGIGGDSSYRVFLDHWLHNVQTHVPAVTTNTTRQR